MGGAGWRYPSPESPSPVPTQERAVDTVRAALDATVELLEQRPERLVTLEAIRQRSGVSQGSLTHHFGGRDGLIAAANVERHLRASAADEAFIRQLDGAFSGPDRAATTVLDMIEAMVSPERRQDRWVRLSAIAAAFGDEDLTATLRRTYTALTDTLTALLSQARESGLLRPDVDVRSAALLVAGQGQGLVLDDMSGTGTDASAWNRIQVVLGASVFNAETSTLMAEEAQRRFGDLWRAELVGAPSRAPGSVTSRLTELRRRARVADGTPLHSAAVGAMLEVALRPGPVPDRSRTTRSDDTRRRFLDATIAALRSHGQRGVDVATLRRSTGVNPQRFHRLFGTRDDLVREARLTLEVRRTRRATAGFATLLATAGSPAGVRSALIARAERLAERDELGAMWQRVETIAASRTDPELREGLGRVQRVARDLMVEQILLAQHRGLIDPMLPPSGVARLLEGSMFWHVLHGLDEARPPRTTWKRQLMRVVRLISPDR